MWRWKISTMTLGKFLSSSMPREFYAVTKSLGVRLRNVAVEASAKHYLTNPGDSAAKSSTVPDAEKIDASSSSIERPTGRKWTKEIHHKGEQAGKRLKIAQYSTVALQVRDKFSTVIMK